MVHCKCIYVHHLSGTESSKQILLAFQHKFCDAIVKQDLQVTVEFFEEKYGKRTALIKGFTVNVRKLKERGTFMKVGSIDAKLEPDDGRERFRDGTFVSTASHKDRAKQHNQFGMTNKLINPFTPYFSQIVMSRFLKLFSNTICTNKIDIKLRAVGKTSGEVDLKYCKRGDKSVLQYRSPLLAGQAICALNNKYISDGDKTVQVQVVAYDTSETLDYCFEFEGFGYNGQVVRNFIDLQLRKGFIPLEVFVRKLGSFDGSMHTFNNQDEVAYMNRYIDIPWLTSIKVVCWKCNQFYKIIGIDLLLNYVAGICGGCQYVDFPSQVDYDKAANQMQGLPLGDPRNKRTALRWEGERFTRLALDSSRDLGGFHICHYPLPLTSESKEQYRLLIVPLIAQDWKDGMLEYKENGIRGKVVQKDLLPSPNTNPGAHRLYAATVEIISSEFWNWEGGNISNVSMDIYCKENGQTILLAKTKSKLFGLKKLSNSVTHIYVQLKLTDTVNKKKFWLFCRPKPSKTDYAAKIRILNNWRKNVIYDIHLNKLIIGIESVGCYKMEDQDLLEWWWNNNFFRNPAVAKLKNSLNESQLEAMKVVFHSNASVVIGPPGTGKTTTASKTIGFLATVEKDLIVACAATNFAADELCNAINRVALTHGLSLRVLRVLAPGKALRKANSSSPFPALHELVPKDPSYLQAEIFLPYIKDIKGGQLHKLPEDVMEALQDHIERIEYQIMSKFNVISCTVQSLADQRVKNWAKKGRRVGTVVIDEAAQLLEANTLHPLTLESRRVIFFGDHNQLNGTCKSISAEEGGLGRSLQETLAERSSSIPTQMLLTQYRMHPDIAELVSHFQYEGKLRHGINVFDRGPQMQFVLNTMTGHQSQKECKRVVVVDNNFKTEKVGNSYRSNEEAVFAVKIAEKLILLGIQKNQIVILTMYDGQNKLIKQMLLCKGIDVTVSNTDAFQGKESRIVILCLTRGEREDGITTRSVGFLSTPNRLNVAISRAQEALFILCNMNYFGKNPNDVVQKFNQLLTKFATIIPASELKAAMNAEDDDTSDFV